MEIGLFIFHIVWSWIFSRKGLQHQIHPVAKHDPFNKSKVWKKHRKRAITSGL